MKLHSFIILLGTAIIFITFCVAIFFAKKSKPFYYKYVFILIVMGLLLSTNTISANNYIWLSGLRLRIFFEQLITLLQYLVTSLFFLEILKKTKFAKKIKWLLSLSILLQITLIIIVHLTNTEIRSGSLPNLIILIFVFFYLKDLMGTKRRLILAQSSTFWLVMGFFFASCIGFPVSCLIPFISRTPEYANLHFQIFSIYNMSLIIMYLFIIKSYLCLMHPQNL